MKKFNRKLLLFFFFLFVLFLGRSAFASDLILSPSSGSYNVGDTIKVRIVLSSPNQSANAISVSISFPKDLLTLGSVSKDNSIIGLWSVDPSYSNISGIVSMEGIILSGFQGNDGTIATLSFKAKAVGDANIKFTTSSVLANDGLGSNILSKIGQANFNLSPLKETVVPVPILAPAPEMESAPPTPLFASNQNSTGNNQVSPVEKSFESFSLPNNSLLSNITNMFSIIVPTVGLIILLILLLIWGWHNISRYKKYVHKKLMETHNIVSKSFDILDEDVGEEVKIFKKIKALQPLTNDERLFINQFKRDIEAAEQVIIGKVEESGK